MTTLFDRSNLSLKRGIEFTERHSLEWIDASKNREEFEERYDEWGSTYDKDLMEVWDYKMPSLIGDLFMKYVKKLDERVLDAGAGTGLAGEYINHHGYNNLFGIDMSRGMLNRAEHKGIYRQLDRMILGEALGFPDNYFDTTLSVGTIGHAPPESFVELIRVTKSSGLIIFNLRTSFYDEPRFHKKQQSLIEEGKWKLVERTAPILAIPSEAPDIYHYIFVYEVQ